MDRVDLAYQLSCALARPHRRGPLPGRLRAGSKAGVPPAPPRGGAREPLGNSRFPLKEVIGFLLRELGTYTWYTSNILLYMVDSILYLIYGFKGDV